LPKAPSLVSIIVAATLLIAISVFLVHDYDTCQAGYVAVYSVLKMWIVCILAALIGLVLLIARRTRRLGVLTLCSGLILPCAFGVGARLSKAAGWVAWADQPMQRFGPDVRAGEVVYFNLGVAEAQIESFQEESLYQARSDGRGRDFRPGITYFLSLAPSQAHGHRGFAIGISLSLPSDRREELKSLIAKSPLVFRVFDDVAPRDIPSP
jgi:uncharacterized integral membrane protein